MSDNVRRLVKKGLALLPDPGAATGATLLIYHRVGGGTSNELDLPIAEFERQMRTLAEHDVVSLDDALDRLDAGDDAPTFVITFDDGFEDVFENAWPVLRELQLPFTIYLASAYTGKEMRWEGATATGSPGRGLTWDQLREMVDSGLCTIGNHTHTHVEPGLLSDAELDDCSATIERHLGVSPRHFTYPWGRPVSGMETSVRQRFRSASTGIVGRNSPATDRMRLRRIPVRRSDPPRFFEAKLNGNLIPERNYSAIVNATKKVRYAGAARGR